MFWKKKKEVEGKEVKEVTYYAVEYYFKDDNNKYVLRFPKEKKNEAIKFYSKIKELIKKGKMFFDETELKDEFYYSFISGYPYRVYLEEEGYFKYE